MLLRSRFRNVTATALAAGVPEQQLRDDLDELAARITASAEVMRPRLSVVPQSS